MSAEDTQQNADDAVEFVLDEPGTVSSGTSPARPVPVSYAEPAEPEIEDAGEDELSPVHKELAYPKLPSLGDESLARLQMQSPYRLFFYWTLRSHPYQTLNKALGPATANYTLALRFLDVEAGTEELHPVDPEGSWWFNVRPDGEYKAEIGFYSPSRPFVRVLYSNTVRTPRTSPSPRSAESAEWSVSSGEFSRALEASGFERDAFDVAIAGDNVAAADAEARSAFAGAFGAAPDEIGGFAADELRFALFALASGAPLESLRWRISPALFALLQKESAEQARLSAADVVRTQFGIEVEEIEEEERSGAVYGASVVNFPRKLKTHRRFWQAPENRPSSSSEPRY